MLGLRKLPLPMNALQEDLKDEVEKLPDDYLTPKKSTPARRGFVAVVTDRWVDAHNRVDTTNNSPNKISNPSVRLDPPFSKRKEIVEEGLAHLPSTLSI